MILKKLKNLKKKKVLIIIAAFAFIALVSFSVSFYYFRRINQNPSSTKTPVSTPTPIATSLPKSLYATDSAILQIKNDLKDLEKNLNTMKFQESQLLPPALDFKVEFEEEINE